MATVFKRTAESQIRFMHQCGRLQRLPGFLLSQFGRREFPQFVIDQRQQLLRRRRIAGFNIRQDASYVGHG